MNLVFKKNHESTFKFIQIYEYILIQNFLLSLHFDKKVQAIMERHVRLELRVDNFYRIYFKLMLGTIYF